MTATGAGSQKRVFVLVNPAAGKGRAKKLAGAATKTLKKEGSAVTLLTGKDRAETRALAEEAVAQKPDVLVLVGGDGTLSAVLDAVVHSGVPVALIPAGTGNDFARSLGLPHGGNTETAEEAARIALHGKPARVDVAKAVTPEREVKFATIAAVGFDALVSERTNQLRWPRGAARYYLAIIIELLRLTPQKFHLSFNGGEEKYMPGTLAAVANTSTYGGGLPISPDADSSDGLLDFTHVAPISRLKLLRLFPLLMTGKHVDRTEVQTGRYKKVEITAPGLIVFADGERIGSDSVSVEVLPQALTVVI